MYLPMEQLRCSGYESQKDVRELFLWKLVQEMADKVNIITNKLEITGNNVTGAVLAYLNILPEDTEGYKRSKVKQKDVAAYLNISQETVSRALGKLLNEHVIERNNHGNIRVLIPDWVESQEQEGCK